MPLRPEGCWVALADSPSRLADIANEGRYVSASRWSWRLALRLLPGRRFGLRQLIRTCPGQLVVGSGSPGPCRPAALLQVIALLPITRYLLQECEVRFRVAVLQEPLHAERRERRDDGGISSLIRQFDGGASGHPAAPGKSDDHRHDGADGYPLEKTSSRLALQH
jgi:hypothetical protein